MKKSTKRREQSKEITIMVLYDSQKKPFQFRIPTLLIRLTCICVLALTVTAAILFSRNMMLDHAIAKTQQSNQTLSKRLTELEVTSKQMESENQRLQDSVVTKESEVAELQGLADEASQKLEELYLKEQEIHKQIESVLPDSVSDAGEGEEEPAEIVAENVTEEYQGMGVTLRPSSSTYVYRKNNLLNNLTLRNTTLASNNLLGLQLPREEQHDRTKELKEKLMVLNQEMANQEMDYDKYMQILTSREFAQKLHEEEMMELRQDVVNYAKKYLGGAYVWGGSNPNYGVDCSGFSQYVLGGAAGVWLNRTAAAQSQQGKKVNIGEAKPGDLIFYGNGSSVNHVAIYMGDGRVIHASNETNGIIISRWNYRTPVAIKNMIGD